MKTTDNPSTVFTESDEILYEELREIAENLKLRNPSRPHNPSVPSNQALQEMEDAYKPEYLDENSRDYQIWWFWFVYLGFAYVQGKLKDKKKKGKYIDTSSNRKREIKRMLNMNYIASGESLKLFYNLPDRFDSFCDSIDTDIKNLK